IKTGHTQEAGYCLVASAVRGGMRLIAVVMGTSGEETRAREAQALLAYGFRYYETTRILTAGQVLSEGNRVWYGEADYLNLAAPEDVHATIPRGSKESLTTEIELEPRSEEHTSELQSRENLVCRLLLEKKKAFIAWRRRWVASDGKRRHLNSSH